jgi:hypothetical protein
MVVHVTSEKGDPQGMRFALKLLPASCDEEVMAERSVLEVLGGKHNTIKLHRHFVASLRKREYQALLFEMVEARHHFVPESVEEVKVFMRDALEVKDQVVVERGHC